MKTKEIIQLVVALVILLAAGYMIYLVLFPQQAAKAKATAASYVQVTPISPNFDPASLGTLNDSSRIHDFYTPPDLSSGLGNNQPFGPLH